MAKLLATCATDSLRDLRDRAILMVALPHASVVDQNVETLTGSTHSSAERPDGGEVRKIQHLEPRGGARGVRANSPRV